MGKRLAQFQSDPWYFRENPDELLAHEGVVRRSAKEWATYLAADRNTIDKQEHLRVLMVRYESLHENVESNRRQMYEFLNVDHEAANPIPESLLPGHSSEKPNEFLRKGMVGDWQNYMTDQAKAWMDEVRMRKEGKGETEGADDADLDDEFLELVNASDRPLDLSGLLIGEVFGTAGAIKN